MRKEAAKGYLNDICISFVHLANRFRLEVLIDPKPPLIPIPGGKTRSHHGPARITDSVKDIQISMIDAIKVHGLGEGSKALATPEDQSLPGIKFPLIHPIIWLANAEK